MLKEKIYNRKNKIIAGGAAFVMAVSGTGIYYVSQPASSVKAADEDVKVLKAAAVEALGDTDTKTDGVYKDETVYVKTDASGKVTETTVSEWLKNPGSGTFEDVSSLKEIKNVKGDEKYTQIGEDTVAWEAQGEDIYYQGKTNQALPVEVNITYKLDGKDILAKDLKGKSGKLEMHIAYKNNAKETVQIDGKEAEMYTPFAMVTALMLPTEEYKNVTVDSGKIISDADKDIVLGLGFPGLTQNLNLQNVDVEIPESVTITADVKKASVGTTITVVSSDLLEKFGLNDVNDFDSFGKSIDQLSNAAGQLQDGSKALADGVNTLNGKTGELKSGVNELADGVNAYAGGVGQLAEGSAALAEGAAKLTEGASKAQGGINDAKAGADKLAAGYTGDGTATNPGANNLIKGVNGAVDQTSEAIDALGTVAAALQASQNNVSVSISGQSEAAAAAVDALVDAGVITQENKDTAVQAVSEAMSSNLTASAADTNAGAGSADVDAIVQGAKTAIGTARTYAGGLEQTISGLYGGTASLQAGLDKLSAGSTELVNGTNTLYSGAAALKDGVAALNKNSSLLITGASKLKDGGSQLGAGVGRLAEGAGTLADGMAEFKSGGIDKLTEVFKGDIEGVTSRINAMMTLGQDYKSFGGIKAGMDGNTKFIIETEEVE